MLSNGQVNHLTWVWRSWKTETKMSQEQAGSGDSCSRGLAEHQQGWNPGSARVVKSCNRVLGSESGLFCLCTFGPSTSGGSYRNCCSCYTWCGCKYLQLKAGSLQLKHMSWWCAELKRWELCRCWHNSILFYFLFTLLGQHTSFYSKF